MKTIKTDFKTALVIDDDQDLCMLLKSLLETIIPKVECAENLKTGMDAITRMLPDVIFVDNNLPDGQSVYNIPQMKKISPNSVVILISAMDNFVENPKDFGATDFLAKPMTMDGIRKVLSMSHA